MRVEVLMTPGCGHGEQTAALVATVLRERAPGAAMERIVIATQEDAARLAFPGSPTVRVNGIDIERCAEERRPGLTAVRSSGRAPAITHRGCGSSGSRPVETVASEQLDDSRFIIAAWRRWHLTEGAPIEAGRESTFRTGWPRCKLYDDGRSATR
jgi:hypothetical protein